MQVSTVKSCKDNLFPKLKSFEPRKTHSLAEFVKDFEKEYGDPQKYHGFISASEFESRMYFIFTPNVANTVKILCKLIIICVLGEKECKNEQRSLSKADKEAKRKANSFKRDPLTQTKLQNFFSAKSSQESPSLPSDGSDDDGGLVIAENSSPDHGDSTIKIDQTDDLSNVDDNDKTLKIETEENYNSGKKQTTKTLYINITLQGIPKQNSDIDVNKIEKNTKQMSSEKSTPIAKRKIKDLFGDSSDSEIESRDTKRCKKSKDKLVQETKSEKTEKSKIEKSRRKHKHKRSTHSDKSHEKVSEKTISQNDSAHEATHNVDHRTTQITANTDPENDHDNIKKQNNADKNNSYDLTNDDSKLDFPETKDKYGDDTSMNKAYKLSLEADKVLKELKHFSEIKVYPELDQTIPDDTKICDSKNAVMVLKSPTKHGTKYKHETNEKDNLKKSDDIKHTKMHKDGKKEYVNKEKSKTKHIFKEKDSTKYKEKKAEKLDVASLVVKLLMPYYKKKKISNRDLFKITARHIVHQLLAIQVTGKDFIYSNLVYFLR